MQRERRPPVVGGVFPVRLGPPVERPMKGTRSMPSGKKRKRKKIATHKRKKRLRKNRHKKKNK